MTDALTKMLVDDAEHARKARIHLRGWLKGKQYYKALQALDYAMEYHSGVRKDLITPEFDHQVIIAQRIRCYDSYLIEPEDTYVSAFLHDIVEDYPITLNEIETRFGKRVREAVDLLSRKYRAEPKPGKTKELYYEMLKEDNIATVIKGFDRIHNFYTMPGVFNAEKQLEYIDECTTFILPAIRYARRKFPQQEEAYESIKFSMKNNIKLIRLAGGI